MGVDWSFVVTLVLALLLVNIATRVLDKRAESTRVGAEAGSPVRGVRLTGNPITDFLLTHYPNAMS